MNNFKSSLEESVCKTFLNLFNQSTSQGIFLERLGDPIKKEPDCICSNNIAVELVGVYDNQYQAIRINNEARNKKVVVKRQLQLLTFDNLQNEIYVKLTKLRNGNYDGFSGKIFLLCHLEMPVLSDIDVRTFIQSFTPFHKYEPFEEHFSAIWLLWKSEVTGEYKILFLE